MALLSNIPHLITLLVILSILVIAHEWGHFIVARIFGIRVDDFSIGFGKRLFRIGKRGDTEYNIRMLPLGGFVKIAGMDADEEPLLRAKEKIAGKAASDDPDAGELPLIAENTSEGSAYHAPDSFNSKPIWQRSLVIFAGPFMSFLLGYVVFCLMGFLVGAPTDKPLNKVAQVEPGGEGQHIGLQAGDEITAIDGLPITDGKQMIAKIHNSLGQVIHLTVQRGSATLHLAATPQPKLDEDTNKQLLSIDVAAAGAAGANIGLLPGDTIVQVDDIDVSSAEQVLRLLRGDAGKPVKLTVTRNDDVKTLTGRLPANLANDLPTLNAHPIGMLKFEPAYAFHRVGFVESLREGNIILVRLFATLGSLIQHNQLRKSAGGVIRMYQATKVADQNGLPEVVFLLGQLSISLAIFNILPIPILDGGHLLTFFIEWVRRGKKMTPQQQQAFLMTGLAIIAVLFLLITSNDIVQKIKGHLPQ